MDFELWFFVRCYNHITNRSPFHFLNKNTTLRYKFKVHFRIGFRNRGTVLFRTNGNDSSGECYNRYKPKSISVPFVIPAKPNLDSVNHCTSKYLFISILISLLVQWLTESRLGKTKFGFPIEIRRFFVGGPGTSLLAHGMSSVRYRTRLGDLKNKQSTESDFGAEVINPSDLLDESIPLTRNDHSSGGLRANCHAQER